MNARRREGEWGSSEPGSPLGVDMKNAVTDRKGSNTQAKPIRNNVNDPRATGVSQIKNSINAPKTSKG